ncbi:MAG: patatin-like phospholipase family protein [Clostridiales bacterium]|nr:patatin-like phospholipase family protein [Clostridiales bacterium]
MIKRGLYLQGGGAKGAYQAGILKALNQKGIAFDALSGTSIGSINGYFYATNQIEQLEKEWLAMAIPKNGFIEDDLFYNNEFLLDMIRKYPSKNMIVKNWYINYALVKRNMMTNRYKDLIKLDFDEMIACIDYSSKLPIRDENKKFNLSSYESMYIDGGLVNNAFVEPLLKLDLDEIIVIPLNQTFDEEKFIGFKGKLIIFYPPKPFQPGDTIRLEKDFIIDWFNVGYNEGMNRKI